MTVFEAGLQIAGGVGDTFEMIRTMIGKDQLALIIAKSFAEAAGFTLSPTDVSKAAGYNRNTAAKAIENTDTSAIKAISTSADRIDQLRGAIGT